MSLCLCSLRRGDGVRGQACVDGGGLYVVGGWGFAECSRAYVVRHKLSDFTEGVDVLLHELQADGHGYFDVLPRGGEQARSFIPLENGDVVGVLIGN